MERKSWLLAALIALGAALIYLPATRYGAVWDDPIVIEQQLPRIDSLARTFFPPPDVPQLAADYYRPLVLLSYRVDAALGGQFHRGTVFWHALATLALFVAARQLARLDASCCPSPTGFAALAAALFAVHPIHVDAVAAMTGRADTMAATFTLGACAAYLAALRQRPAAPSTRHVALAALGLFAAALSKETGVAGAAWLVWFDLRYGGSDRDARVRRMRWIAAALAAYLVLRWLARTIVAGSGSSLALADPPAVAPDRWGAWGALGWSLRKLVWPPPQSPFVPSTAPLLDPLLGVCTVLVIAGLLIWSVRSGRARLEALTAWCGVTALAPALAIPFLGITYLPVAERYLYLPSAALCLVLSAWIGRWSGSLRARWWLAALTLVSLGTVQCWRHQPIWRDELSLWRAAQHAAPRHPIPYAMLAAALQRAGRLVDAERTLRAGIEDTTAWNGWGGRAVLRSNLAALLRQRGDEVQAIEVLGAAIEDDPSYWPAYYNRALALQSLALENADPERRAGFIATAVDALARAALLAPERADVALQLGMALRRAGRADEARDALRRVIERFPNSPEASEARRADPSQSRDQPPR